MGTFSDGLKLALKIEVCRDPSMNFEEASLMASRLDLLINGSSSTFWGGGPSMDEELTPMEIGNVESRRRHGRCRFTEQQMDDIRQGRCFVCNEK